MHEFQFEKRKKKTTVSRKPITRSHVTMKTTSINTLALTLTKIPSNHFFCTTLSSTLVCMWTLLSLFLSLFDTGSIVDLCINPQPNCRYLLLLQISKPSLSLYNKFEPFMYFKFPHLPSFSATQPLCERKYNPSLSSLYHVSIIRFLWFDFMYKFHLSL